MDFGGEDGGDFAFDTSRLHTVTGNVVLLHSKDDPVVPFTHAEMYKKALPNAELIPFSDKGHFLVEAFPELIEHIKNRSITA
jgi:hypothetical protein